MKILVEKDKNRRKLFLKKEKKRKVILFLLREPSLSLDKKIILTQYLRDLPKDSSITRFKNRCVLTNRGRGITQDFKLSRIRLRELLSQGMIPGYKKASW
jgi:small subunit ribosomal protein S14